MPTPQIASSAIERANQQMARDPALTEFAGGVAYQIKKQGYWTKTGSDVPIGLVREITFAKQISTKMQRWPVMVWRTDMNDYESYAYNAQYKNVSTAVVYLAKDRGVVGIVPGEGAITIQGPGNGWMKDLPKEGPR